MGLVTIRTGSGFVDGTTHSTVNGKVEWRIFLFIVRKWSLFDQRYRFHPSFLYSKWNLTDWRLEKTLRISAISTSCQFVLINNLHSGPSAVLRPRRDRFASCEVFFIHQTKEAERIMKNGSEKQIGPNTNKSLIWTNKYLNKINKHIQHAPAHPPSRPVLERGCDDTEPCVGPGEFGEKKTIFCFKSFKRTHAFYIILWEYLEL